MDSLYKFTNKSYHCLPDEKSKNIYNSFTFENFVTNDMRCLGCLLTEMAFFNKIKCLPEQNPLSIRCTLISNMLNKQPHIVMSGIYL